jgi:hypothetical protein
MALGHVALVSQTNRVTLNQLAIAAAALQKQVARDFRPIWDTDATCNAFGLLTDVPLGYWAIIIRDDIPFPGAGGIHLNKTNGQPFALVRFSQNWSLTTSHELLEMLADPFGSRIQAAQSVKTGQGRVEYIVEVCDPSEAPRFAYTVNGVQVSDFYTPHFFDPVASSGARYSFTGAITKPRQVLDGGYLSWREPVTNHLWQLFVRGSQKQFVDRGLASADNAVLRAMSDRFSDEFRSKVMEQGIPAYSSKACMTAAVASFATGSLIDTPTDAHAVDLQQQIDAIVAGNAAGSTAFASGVGGGRNAQARRTRVGGRKGPARSR